MTDKSFTFDDATALRGLDVDDVRAHIERAEAIALLAAEAGPRAYFVDIVSRESGEVAEHMGPLTRQEASGVERGANINLNHEDWKVVVVAPDDESPEQNHLDDVGGIA